MRRTEESGLVRRTSCFQKVSAGVAGREEVCAGERESVAVPPDAEVIATEKVARMSGEAWVLRICEVIVQPVKLIGAFAPFFSVSP
jgi:hypothetical protein